MKKQTKDSLLCVALAAAAAVLVYVAYQPAEAAEAGSIRTIQCIDTASQETVFEQDFIRSAANDYDHWVLQVNDELISYMQPTGVYCTLRASVMAVENATGKVDQ